MGPTFGRVQWVSATYPDGATFPSRLPPGSSRGPGGAGRPGGPRRRRRPPAASRRARPRALTRRVNVTNPTHFPTPLCRALDDAQVNAHVVTHKVIRAVSNSIRAPRLDVRTLRSRCVARPLRGPYFPSPIPSAKLCRSLRAYWPLMACCTAAAHCAASSSVAALNGIEISTEV